MLETNKIYQGDCLEVLKTFPEFCIMCGCPEKGIVLDPFAGSGTTLFVAKHSLRRFIGIELNENYIKLINKKLSQNLLLFEDELI